MLSYRHAFHAGNHADVLKHFIYAQVLHYFNQKDKPYWAIDTHAGAGAYALDSGFATQNAEWKNGILKIVKSAQTTPELSHFLNIIQQLNGFEIAKNTSLKIYPGSPILAQKLIRAEDKLRLFELHPTDIRLLEKQFSEEKRQVKIAQVNGFEGIKACLPPPTKRAVVLIDPPYELKTDYQAVVKCVEDSLKRFATGTLLIWYPILQRPEPLAMVEKLKKLLPDNWLDARLQIENPRADGFGMHASGVFIFNPPWVLPEILNRNLPLLRDLLALDAGANFTLTHQIR